MKVAAELLRRRESIYLGRDHASARANFASAEDHLLALGPPRCGKTSGIIIPSVATHPGPVIVTSTRDDVITATASARHAIAKAFGGSVVEVVFGGSASGAIDAARWSCTDGCGDWNTARDRANTLAGAAIPNHEDRFWKNAGADLLAGCLFAAALFGEDDNAMSRRIELADLYDYHVVVFEQCPEDHPAPAIFKRFEEGSGAMAADTRASVFATLTSQVLNQFGYERSDVATEVSIAEFVKSWGAIYITAPLERAEALGPLVTAFVAAVATAWVSSQRLMDGVSGTLLLALDEVANIAPLPKLPSLLTSGAGDKIQCILGMQEPGQASRWGAEASVIVGGTTHVALFRGLANHAYLDGISKLQQQTMRYDLKVEVKRDTPGGPRFADERALISERLEIEQAMGEGVDHQRQLRAKRAVRAIAQRRMRSGTRCRVEDADGSNDAVLTEILRYTTVHQEPVRRSAYEATDIARGKDQSCFIVTRSQGEFRYMVPWIHDPTWSRILG